MQISGFYFDELSANFEASMERSDRKTWKQKEKSEKLRG